MSSAQQPAQKNRFYRLLGRLPFAKLNLAGALGLAVGAACVLVAIGYLAYWNDPNRKYDLARPGEKDNLLLKVEDEEADTTSPVTAEAAKQKIDYLKKEIKALQGVSSFEVDELSDQNIQLVPGEQPSL